ncbi:MAG: HD-GYP domain-containing protein (c-di-GMP phosphodiesterase class II) [Candidatus Omnitrophota bacterium]|jgi:HD-GYP domain-containing protein (c-di-GMP phosphodiesterase class II)
MNLSANKNENQEHYYNLYKELYSVVKLSMTLQIDKVAIDNIIREIVRAFMHDNYNPLLLHFYSLSTTNYLISHIVNNVTLAIAFGCSIDLSEKNLHNLGLVSFCHDFGMIEYTHLFQKDSKLSSSENKTLQDHPAKSVEIFKDIFSEHVLDGIADTHEQVNGQGYPKGKSGPEIQLLSKIVSICDVYEALTHQRIFRQQIIPYEAMKLIIAQKDKFFDDKIVKRFVDFMSIYPIGSLVYLNTGEIGIVIGSNYGYPTRSIIQILLTSNKEIEQSEKISNLLTEKMIYVNKPVPAAEEKELLKILKPRGTIEL